MTAGFVGRKTELALLHKRLAGVTASGAGIALIIRGRRQVGKSRLAQEFCDRAGVFTPRPRARRR
jgi:AAA+ ATPase superfamily predicted ATPase